MRRTTTAALAVAIAIIFAIGAFRPSCPQAAAARSAATARGMGMNLSRPDASRKFDSGSVGAGLPMAASVDLSADVPPISDQGTHASCVGFATGYYGKTWWEKQEHPAWDITDNRYQTSPAFIYNKINGGEDDGASIYDAFQLMENTGACDWSEFPYDGNYVKQPDSTDTEAARQYKISSSWGYFFSQPAWAPPTGYAPANDISQIKARLNAGKPVVLGIPIYDDFPDYGGNPDSSFYSSADYYSSGDFKGGHAVFIVGYDDSAGGGLGGFKAINSWGPTWNGNGQVFLSYKFVKKWVPEAWYFDDLDSSPTVASMSPANGGPDALVTISGSNFGANRRSARVGFQGGVNGSVVSWSNAQVKVRVPDDASDGNVYLYDWNGEKSNGKLFSASSTPGASWLFAEGATWPGFDEWVLLQNPNDSPSSVTVTFMTPEGRVPGPDITVPAQSRVSVHVNDYVPNRDVATAVYVTGGPEVCAERAVYVNAQDGKWGSHDSIGARNASETWYMAEGATWPGYEEWVLVLNPNEEPVQAGLTFQTPAGQVAGPKRTLEPFTRWSVRVNDYIPAGDVSTEVRSLTSGRGVVAERSMYVRTADGKVDCHNSIGATEPSQGWGMAEGATWPGYEEWVLVQNPTRTAAGVNFFFLTPEGVKQGPVMSVAPGRRVSVRVNDYLPGSDVSTMVLTDRDDQAVVVERAMYIRAAGGKLGSHNSVGSIYGSTGWYLPEGCTSPGFDEWVLVMNPEKEESAGVRLTFMTPGGLVNGPYATVPPASRKTFHVNEYVTGDVSTMVESDGYVVCERSMYVRTGDGKAGATCSLGLLASYIQAGGSAGGSGGGMSAPMTVKQVSRLRSQYLSR